MTLEATLTYLVALAVPVWLLVEQIVSRRRSSGEGAAQPRPADSRAATDGKARKAAAPPAASVTPGLGQKAA